MGNAGRKPSITDDDIIAVFQNASDPFLTTREVVDQVSIGHRGTYDRLEKLANEDVLRMKKVGKSNAVWWYPPALHERYGGE